MVERHSLNRKSMTVKKGILEHQKGRKRPRKSVRERIKPDLGESCWNLLGQWRPLLAHFWFLCRLEMRIMMTYSRSRRKKEKSKVKSGPRQLLQTCAPACFQQSSRPGSLRPSTLTSATHVLWLLTASICHLHLDARPTHQTLPIASAVYLALTPAWVLDEEGDTARPSHRAKARTLRRGARVQLRQTESRCGFGSLEENALLSSDCHAGHPWPSGGYFCSLWLLHIKTGSPLAPSSSAVRGGQL